MKPPDERPDTVTSLIEYVPSFSTVECSENADDSTAIKDEHTNNAVILAILAVRCVMARCAPH